MSYSSSGAPERISAVESYNKATNPGAQVQKDGKHNCTVRFRQEKHILCLSGKNHYDGLRRQVVQGLLEKEFGCSAQHIGVKNMSDYPSIRFDRICFWFLESKNVQLETGDHLWGSSIQRKTIVNANKLTTTRYTIDSTRDALCILSRELRGYMRRTKHTQPDIAADDESFGCRKTVNLRNSRLIVENLIRSFPYDLFQSVPLVNSTLIIILGNLRGGEAAWNSFCRHVLDLNNADLMLFTVGSTPDNKRNSSLYLRAKYVMEIPHFSDWADAIDIMMHGNQTWRTTVPPVVGNQSILLGGSLGIKGSGALIFMARWFLSHYLQEMRIHLMYDRFVVTRSDHYYKCNHDLKDLLPAANSIYIPKGQDWKGLCDRHMVVSSKHIYRALDLIEPLIQHPQSYLRYLKKGGLQNTESFLKTRWEENGLLRLVKRFPRPMFTCAVPGDNYMWIAPQKDIIPEGVFVKYKMEYALAKSECTQSLIRLKTEATVTANDFTTPPKGVLLKGNTQEVSGWACDSDDPLSGVKVRVEIWNNSTSEIVKYEFMANLRGSKFSRNECGGGLYHRFQYPLSSIPSYMKAAASTGQVVIRAFAVDLLDPLVTSELTNSPMVMLQPIN